MTREGSDGAVQVGAMHAVGSGPRSVRSIGRRHPTGLGATARAAASGRRPLDTLHATPRCEHQPSALRSGEPQVGAELLSVAL